MCLIDDAVYKVDRASGKIIWRWKASEHLKEMGFGDADSKAMQNYEGKLNGEGEGSTGFIRTVFPIWSPTGGLIRGINASIRITSC